MYIIKMADNKELINCSYDKAVYQKESLVDEVLFLIPQKYNGLSLSDFNVVLEYIDAANTPHAEILKKNNGLYKEYLAYTLPVDTSITAYAGNVTLNLSISKVDMENRKHYILHTGEAVIPVLKRNDYYNFVPEESLEFVDKIVANLDVKINEIKDIAGTYDKIKADNIKKTDNKIQLTSNGNPIGDEIIISSSGGSGNNEGFEIVEF